MKKIKKMDLENGLKDGKFYRVIRNKRFVTDRNGDTILVPELVETNNFDLLHAMPHDLNRPLSVAHVHSMGKSVTKLGASLRAVVLVEFDFQLYVVDGNHLINYMKSVDLPVDCYVYPVDNLQDALTVITTMNGTARRWGLAQYIKSWCFFKPEYRILLDFKRKYGIQYGTLAALMSGTPENQAKKDIESGDFKMRGDETRILRIIQAINHFYTALNVDTTSKHYTTKGLIYFIADKTLETYLENEKALIAAAIERAKQTPFQAHATAAYAIGYFNSLFDSL